MSKLYGLLVLPVLLLSGCGGSNGQEDPPAPAPDTAEATISPPSAEDTSGSESPQRILFLGNSLTAGLGVRQNEAYPALIRERIDSLGWNFEVVNAGLSGDTSSGGLRRLDWLLRDSVDVLVLALGANDGLRGLSPAAMKENLITIIERTRERSPGVRIVLAGMKMPPNLGREYTQAFERAFVQVAEEEDVAFVPFLLEEVGGVPSLNQPDGVHPNAAGHRVIAETVWDTLRSVLEDVRSSATA